MKTKFRFERSDDPELTDDQYVLIANENITVQVCAYGGRKEFAVNEYGQDDQSDDSTFWVRDHGIFRTLNAAMAKAVAVAA